MYRCFPFELGDLTLAPQSLISFKTALSLQLGLYIMTGR